MLLELPRMGPGFFSYLNPMRRGIWPAPEIEDDSENDETVRWMTLIDANNDSAFAIYP